MGKLVVVMGALILGGCQTMGDFDISACTGGLGGGSCTISWGPGQTPPIPLEPKLETPPETPLIPTEVTP